MLDDLIAKISADKGISFDFTNNENLKNSGLAVEGRTVNGFVKDGVIMLNMDSSKALHSVVGHEVTHVLEGTDLYAELQIAVKEYAITKGEYQSRYDALAKLYESVEGANIENELTADLIGDYLFTDSDFVSKLSTEKPNIFKKIYDEIKYLFKVVTAGSKEARELEKVKRTFEKAYKETMQTTEGDVKRSLIAIDGKYYSPTYEKLISEHPTIGVTDITDAKYQKGQRMSDSEYQEYRTIQTVKAKENFGIYTNKDTSYSDEYGEIRAEFGNITVKKGQSYGGIALYDILPHIGEIFENAIVVDTKADRNNDSNIRGIVDLVGGAILGDGSLAVVKLNVKEYVNREAKLYDNRVIEIEELTVVGGVVHQNDESTSPAVSSDYILNAYRNFVNKQDVSRPSHEIKNITGNELPVHKNSPAPESDVSNNIVSQNVENTTENRVYFDFTEKKDTIITYDTLISKPDMAVSKITTTIEEVSNKSRIEIVSDARERLSSFKNERGAISIRNDDMGIDIVVGKDGISHGLDRNFEYTAMVSMHLDNYLKNAVKVNEAVADATRTHDSDILLGYGETIKGEKIPAYFVVSKLKNKEEAELLEYGFLYSIRAKKIAEDSTQGSPGLQARTSANISVSELLDIVNETYSDILPKAVADHYGITRRQTKLGNSVKYSMSGVNARTANSSMLLKAERIKVKQLPLSIEKQYLKAPITLDHGSTVSHPHGNVKGEVPVTLPRNKELIIRDIRESGFLATPSLVSNIEKLNGLTGRTNLMKDICDSYKLGCTGMEPEEKEVIEKIAEECKKQELAKQLTVEAEPEP